MFPELKESEDEDERIRKALLRCCDDWEKGQFGCMNAADIPAIRAYLKKQKEPLPVPDKFSGLKSLMLQYLQSAANHKDDTEIESDTDLFGQKILDYV